MKCEYYIKNNLCLGCNLAEQNIEAEKCQYRDKAINLFKQKIEQMKMEGLDDNKNSNVV